MRSLWMLVLLLAAGLTLAGCEAVVGIFKAGVWTGVVMVAFLLLAVGFVVAKMRA